MGPHRNLPRTQQFKPTSSDVGCPKLMIQPQVYRHCTSSVVGTGLMAWIGEPQIESAWPPRLLSFYGCA